MKQIKKIIVFVCITVNSIFFGMDLNPVILTKKKIQETILDEECFTFFLQFPNTLPIIMNHIVNQKEWWYRDEMLIQGANIKIARYNPSGTQMAIASGDRVHVFDIEQKQEIASCVYNNISSLCYDKSGKHLLIGSWGGKVSSFNIKKGKITSSCTYHKTLTALCTHPSKKQIATGFDPMLSSQGDPNSDKKVRIFPLNKKKAIVSFRHDRRVNSVCYHPSGNTLVTGSNDGSIRFFDIKKREGIASFKQDNHTAVCYTPSGNVVIGSSDGTVRIVNTNTQKQTASMIHSDGISSVCCHPLKPHLAIVGSDNKVFIFKRYDQSTLEQVALRKMILAWLLIEKPYKEIDSPELLLKDVATKYQIDHKDIFRIWLTLSEHVRSDIWLNMWYNIRKYGKRIKRTKSGYLIDTGKREIYGGIAQTYSKQVREQG